MWEIRANPHRHPARDAESKCSTKRQQQSVAFGTYARSGIPHLAEDKPPQQA